MTWFEKLTGIAEKSPEHVRRELSLDADHIVCPNGKRFAFGRLVTPKLSDLRQAVAELDIPPRRSIISEVVGDVRKLHIDAANANALFQVASQFNLLEMTSPAVTPERGVGIYEFDATQGPACAIACGAGTIYRNYFAPVVGHVKDPSVTDQHPGSLARSTTPESGCVIGQTAENQIDCSADLGAELGNTNQKLWRVQNGYLFPSDNGLAEITRSIQSASEIERDTLLGHLRIGLQLDAEVTLSDAGHRVCQAYCSALPVAYGRQPTDQWTDFAKLILDAAYEATLAASVLNAARTGNRLVYLTLLGGGVFGNRDYWIIGAIERALMKHLHHGLDVRIVSHGRSKTVVTDLIQRINKTS